MVKQCPNCNCTKDELEFAKDTTRKNGLQSWCRDCVNTRGREKYKTLSEDEKEIRRKYVRVFQKTPRGKYAIYKQHARDTKRDFTLTLDEFTALWRQPCFYCNTSIDTIGLDRINNNKGYILDNVVPCCGTCNHA